MSRATPSTRWPGRLAAAALITLIGCDDLDLITECTSNQDCAGGGICTNGVCTGGGTGVPDDTEAEGGDADCDSDADTDTDTDGDGDGDTESDANTDTETGLDVPWCSMERPQDCITDFENGTVQAGVNGDYPNIGFYAYTDGEDGTIIPAINHDGAEPAVEMASNDPSSEFVMHFKADGFTTWGAGADMYWGGAPNPACEAKGALECLQIGLDDVNFDLFEAEDDPRCDTAEKLECLKHGKQLKVTRDLSAYSGIGFWAKCAAENEARELRVNFPIPDTVRFEGECSMEDGVDSTACYNDFAAIVQLSSTPGAWRWHQVRFDSLNISPDWGLQLDYPTFPKDQSMGIRFLIDETQQPFDIYLDDIILLRDMDME